MGSLPRVPNFASSLYIPDVKWFIQSVKRWPYGCLLNFSPSIPDMSGDEGHLHGQYAQGDECTNTNGAR